MSALQAARARALLDWDDHIRPANVRIALGVCALALFLALPILDFGAMSARDQLARLKAGVTEAQKFDWRAMAFDFGPQGRAALQRLSKIGSVNQQKAAKAALESNDRWNVEEQVKLERNDAQEKNFSFQPVNKKLDRASRVTIIRAGLCNQPCQIVWLGDKRLVIVGNSYENGPVDAVALGLTKNTNDRNAGPNGLVWQREYNGNIDGNQRAPGGLTPQSRVELRAVEMQQAFVDGVAVGEPIKK